MRDHESMVLSRKKSFKIQTLQVLDEKGNLLQKTPPALSDNELKRLYELLILTRAFDEKAIILQRQGRLGTYASIRGQEAVSVAAGFALQKDDWLFPAFRDYGAYFARNFSIAQLLLYWSGDERGGQIPDDQRIFTVAVPVGTQIPHAVGAAWAARLRQESHATLVFFGDGATSEGDFHEGLNIAGVNQLPVVFLCQNNQWAISVPRSRQTASKTIAQKAIAYGFPGIQVDGNDILGVYEATRNALSRARKGNGPTLIEAVTYRLGDHTTADDAVIYRDEKEVKLWTRRDPIIRFERYLASRGLWTLKNQKQVLKDAKNQVESAIVEMEAMPPQDPDSIFTYTLNSLPWNLEEQLRDFKEYLQNRQEEQ